MQRSRRARAVEEKQRGQRKQIGAGRVAGKLTIAMPNEREGATQRPCGRQGWWIVMGKERAAKRNCSLLTFWLVARRPALRAAIATAATAAAALLFLWPGGDTRCCTSRRPRSRCAAHSSQVQCPPVNGCAARNSRDDISREGASSGPPDGALGSGSGEVLHYHRYISHALPSSPDAKDNPLPRLRWH